MTNKNYIIKGVGLGFVITIGIVFQSLIAIIIAALFVLLIKWVVKSINQTTNKFRKPKRNSFGIKC